MAPVEDNESVCDRIRRQRSPERQAFLDDIIASDEAAEWDDWLDFYDDGRLIEGSSGRIYVIGRGKNPANIVLRMKAGKVDATIWFNASEAAQIFARVVDLVKK